MDLRPSYDLNGNTSVKTIENSVVRPKVSAGKP